MDAEVAVVGGRVAGAATALHLARHGVHVVLLERAAVSRSKPCGEGLMPHGVEELAMLGVLPQVLRAGARPFGGVAWHAGGLRAEGRFPAGEGLGVPRAVLDPLLLQSCIEEGVDVREAVVREVQRDGAGVTLRLAEGAVRARVVVGADGLHSLVRRSFGLGAPSRSTPRFGVRTHLRLRDGSSDPPLVEVHAGPSGEHYLTPVRPGVVNLALLCDKRVTRGFGGDLRAGMDRILPEAPVLERRLRGAVPVGQPLLTGPLRQRVRRVVDDRVLLVGDAAGFVDAVTGEGMSLALASARVAADVLAEALRADRLDATGLAPYARERARMARDKRLFTELVLWWARQPRLARRVVRNLGRHPDAFGRLLAVNAGQAGLWTVGVRDLLRVALGV